MLHISVMCWSVNQDQIRFNQVNLIEPDSCHFVIFLTVFRELSLRCVFVYNRLMQLTYSLSQFNRK